MWLLLRSGTIRLVIISRILSCIFEGIVLLRKWRVILVFYCLVFYCVILVCSVCLYFNYYYYYFCNWSFRKTLWRRLSLVISFYYCFSPINTLCVFCVERRGDYMKMSCLRCFDVEYRWSVCSYLAGGFFSTDICWKLWLFYLRNELIYYFY